MLRVLEALLWLTWFMISVFVLQNIEYRAEASTIVTLSNNDKPPLNCTRYCVCSNTTCSCFLSKAQQDAHNVFIPHEACQGYVYHCREEEVEWEVEWEGCKHSPLAKTLFYEEPVRAHAVVELHACPHVIVKLTDD